jgi:thioredoxin-like negative regulator of GroEL
VFDTDERTFRAAVLERSRALPVVVFFTSGAAPLCGLVEAAVQEEINRQAGAVALVRVDADRDRRLAERCGIWMLPTLVAFRRGQPVGNLLGARRREAVARFLDALGAPNGAQRLVEELRAEHEGSTSLSALDELDSAAAFEALVTCPAHGGGTERGRIGRSMLSLLADPGRMIHSAPATAGGSPLPCSD